MGESNFFPHIFLSVAVYCKCDLSMGVSESASLRFDRNYSLQSQASQRISV